MRARDGATGRDGGAVSDRANDSSTPQARSTDSRDVPPCDMNGRGDAENGEDAQHDTNL